MINACHLISRTQFLYCPRECLSGTKIECKFMWHQPNHICDELVLYDSLLLLLCIFDNFMTPFLQVEKIYGPGNQYVTAAKMILQVYSMNYNLIKKLILIIKNLRLNCYFF